MATRFRFFIVFGCLLFTALTVFAQQKTDTTKATKSDSLRYPILDRRGDRFTWQSHNPFDLPDSSIIKQTIEYDPVLKEYVIVETIGNTVYRTPTTLTFEEFYQLQAHQSEIDYFNQREEALSILNDKEQRPKPNVYEKLFDRIFGLGPNGLRVDIKPQGSVDLTAGYQGQFVNNPTLPEGARRNGGPDFNMDANVNILGSIGDKLKLPISYNTAANFNFQNQLKLDYKGMDDELLKSVEAGNIAFQTKGTLMTSVQSLFGLKTQLQFGKLLVTAVIANENSTKQSVNLQGGGLTQQVNKKMDDYDENRNFLLAQYFKTNYNTAMANLPIVQSQVQILKIEVWVTNHNGTTANTNARTIVALADLGENSPYNPRIIPQSTYNNLPDNGSNNLYSTLVSDSNNRNPTYVFNGLQNRGLTPVNDFERTYARELDPSEYYFNPQVGFLCLQQQLQPSDVLSVAYQYTYNGQVFQVGEFAEDVTVDSTVGIQKVLFLKMLKATSQRTALPIWQLMMKNIYTLGVSTFQSTGFNINLFYSEPGGGTTVYLPQSSKITSGRPLLTLLNLDRLNYRGDPVPDGRWDFVDSLTVIANQGKVIFPVLQPFGRDLKAEAYQGEPDSITNKYIFNQLYDSIKAIAQTFANLDHFVIEGNVTGTNNSQISLGAFNIPPGSVVVTAGGQTLQENTDYIVDYNLGTIQIINQAIVNSGVPVNVQFENNATAGIQQKSFFGLRGDYQFSKKLSIGATIEKLSERPFFTKEDYGEDPISNTMYGVDFNYNSAWPGLTNLLNHLPNYSTTAPSSITAYGEAALLHPGHAPQIGKGENGVIYIDDFEGSTSNVDLRFPFVSWALASTPAGNGLFPEAALNDSIEYGENRAKLAWYNIDPTMQDKTNPNNPLRNNLNALSDPRVRQVFTNELFPQVTTNITNVLTTTFDLAYYPTDPGPYNFTSSKKQIGPDGKLFYPERRWGGIMRSLDQTDFETGNIQYVEFWLQDPFILDPSSTGGKLMIDMGSVSEDILKDGRLFYENGLSTPSQPAPVDSTSTWGLAPLNPIQITQAFSNVPSERPLQDVGFDGLNDAGERVYRAGYLKQLAANFGTGSEVYERAFQDPSADNYVWYRDATYDANNTGLLGRYKQYNNPQGNSPVVTGNSIYSPAATVYPDNEDLNHDNTLEQTEAYYEYEVDLKPGMDVGLTKFITQKTVVHPQLANGQSTTENWYLFRVPITDFTTNVGNLPDFRSIQYIRMYLTGFQDSAVMRFAELSLVRNTWRTFTYVLDTTGSYTPLAANSVTTLNVSAVNVEQNSARTPIPYVIPPGIEREQILANNGVNILQNEQSMSLKVLNLANGDARAVFKTVNLDIRRYGELSMFIHAESVVGQLPVLDSNLYAVIRIGQDFLTNYYEIRIPLVVTLPSTTATADQVWPASNNLDFALQSLVQLKLQRDSKGIPITTIYRQPGPGNKTFAVLGNPNLAQVEGILIAVENARTGNSPPLDAEVWVDELRLSKINEQGGWAALERTDIKLADLGTLTLSANTYSAGWGTLEQSVNQRSFNDMFQFDAATNMDLGKLFPKSFPVSMPTYASISRTVLTPEYDPYDQDVLLSYKIGHATKFQADSIRLAALDQTTIETINFTNVRFGKRPKKPKILSLYNFDFSYSYTNFHETSPTDIKNSIITQRGGFGYTFNGTAKYVEPFKKIIKSKSKWYSFIKDFNFNLTPSLISFRSDLNKQDGFEIPRLVNTYNYTVLYTDSAFNNLFTFDRYYNFRWDLTKSLNFDFTATNNSVIDEPYGLINTKAKKDTVLKNFFQGGRNVQYQQNATLSYNVPLAKIPALDWISARYSYTTTYNWIGASLLAEALGNTIENTQQNNFNGELDLTKLYNKSKFLAAANAPVVPGQSATPTAGPSVPDSVLNVKPKKEFTKGLHGHARRLAIRKWRAKKRAARKARRLASGPPQISGPVKTVARFVTMLKKVSVSYSESFDSRVPGFMDSSRILGNDFNTMQPGLGYVFGKQPDTSWLNQKAKQGVLSRDTAFNLFYQQDLQQNLNISAQLEPFREFIIALNLQKSFSKSYQEEFKDTTGFGAFGHLSPYANGGFSESFVSFQTLFKAYNPNQISSTFQQFESNRLTISKRLAGKNPYQKLLPASQQYTADGYATGYGRYSEEVLIPAFIAAYTGKNASTISLVNEGNSNIKANPFSGYGALPNWRLTYTGLSKIPSLSDVFTNITISHAYSSTLSMNSFTSALNYYDPYHLGSPAFIDTISGSYVPYYLVPNITIQEQFTPLIGIDVTTKKQLNLHFQYIKSRQLSLSLIDYQLSEVRSTEWDIGGGFRKKGVNLPFRVPFTKGKKLQNDLNVMLTLSMRNDTQSNSQLDQESAYSTGGQRVITIQPSVDYVMSNRVKIKFYFNQQHIIPYISTTAPVTNTSFGIQINISLSPTPSQGSGSGGANGSNNTIPGGTSGIPGLPTSH